MESKQSEGQQEVIAQPGEQQEPELSAEAKAKQEELAQKRKEDEEKYALKRKQEAEEKEKRRIDYMAMMDLEMVLPDTSSEEKDDVTELIFKAVDLLNDCELLTNNDILFETMSSFEVMDKKMDMRLHRKDFPTPTSQIEKGILIVDKPLDKQQLVAILDEFFVQICTWQQQNAQVQQTIYSCQYLIKKEYYDKNPVLVAYVDALHYIIYEFYSASRTTATLRDEDLSFTPFLVNFTKLGLMEIVQNIDDILKSDQVDNSIVGHLNFIKSLAMIIACMFKKEDIKEEIKEEKKQTKSQKNKKKGKKGGEQSEVHEKISDIAVHYKKLASSIELIQQGQCKEVKLQEWAQSVFDEKIIHSLPMTSAKKIFKRQDFDFSVAYFKDFSSNLLSLLEIKNSIYMEDLAFEVARFTETKPCSMLVLLYEKTIVSDNYDAPIFDKLSLQDYQRKGLIEVFPFVRDYYDSDEFKDFFMKYCIMQKEFLLKQLRNKARQRRNIVKYIEDLNILLYEANMYDMNVLERLQSGPRNANTVALQMVISVILGLFVEMLQRGFELDLYTPHEYAMIYNYLSHLYEGLIINRRNIIQGIAGDEIVRYGMIDYEDLNKSHDKFKQKRQKMSLIQKQYVDEYEYFRGMARICAGMAKISAYALKEGIIRNVFEQEGVEKQVYQSRFSCMEKLPFPKYFQYSEYREQLLDVEQSKMLIDAAKADFNEGKNCLQKLLDADDSMRNTKVYSRQMIDKIQKLAVRNSLNGTMMSMQGKNCVVKLNKANSLPQLIAIDVEKKK